MASILGFFRPPSPGSPKDSASPETEALSSGRDSRGSSPSSVVSTAGAAGAAAGGGGAGKVAKVASRIEVAVEEAKKVMDFGTSPISPKEYRDRFFTHANLDKVRAALSARSAIRELSKAIDSHYLKGRMTEEERSDISGKLETNEEHYSAFLMTALMKLKATDSKRFEELKKYIVEDLQGQAFSPARYSLEVDGKKHESAEALFEYLSSAYKGSEEMALAMMMTCNEQGTTELFMRMREYASGPYCGSRIMVKNAAGAGMQINLDTKTNMLKASLTLVASDVDKIIEASDKTGVDAIVPPLAKFQCSQDIDLSTCRDRFSVVPAY